MLDAGAMPPLLRVAQNVNLASTGELNLGKSSTVKPASFPGSRCICESAAYQQINIVQRARAGMTTFR